MWNPINAVASAVTSAVTNLAQEIIPGGGPRPAGRPQVRDHRTEGFRDRLEQFMPDLKQAAETQFSSIFNDPNLSFEDKLLTLLFKIMEKMDKDIFKKAEELEKSKGGTVDPETGKPTSSDSAAGGGSSFDKQLTNLKSLQTRRQALFDTINAIVDKFDTSAEKVIRELAQ